MKAFVNRLAICAFAGALSLGFGASAACAGETVLYAFKGGSDGDHPNGVVRDKAGNLYGTTSGGGVSGCTLNGCGTVFKVARNGAESVLWKFRGSPDGANPAASLLLASKGNLYGTTQYGGASNAGVVFKIAANGSESVLYSFCRQQAQGCTDGSGPLGGLIGDKAGNLYGTTFAGGNGGEGVVFKLTPNGTESVLYNFCSQSGCSDGMQPLAGLIADKAGNLYGTTLDGGYRGGTGLCNGYGCGTVFKLSPGGTETVLYAFQGGADGAYPEAGVIADQSGNLYGTAARGGDTNCPFNHSDACGVVFRVAASGGESVLHAFAGFSDGAYPGAGLIMDHAGNLYGTAYEGGEYQYGTDFKIAPDGSETTLYNFAGGTDGSYPVASLIRHRSHLYGAASHGGDPSCQCGVVFELK